MVDVKPNKVHQNTHYRAASVALHWLMLLLIAAVYACIELRELYPKGSDPREGLKHWHFMLGLLVFVLVWIRLIVRGFSNAPAIIPQPPVWQRLLAKSTHIALYGLMIFMPLAGWVILSAAGKDIPFFGLSLPPLIGENKELAGFIKGIHETVGLIGYFLIGLHACGALFHHYFLRDNTLLRILPNRN
ncbi:MAG: cytochrome b [Spongiibacteraceae bacterium]